MIWASPVPKTIVIWAFPSHITLAIRVRVRVRDTGDANITRVLGTGMPKKQGCPYHCDSDTGEESDTKFYSQLRGAAIQN